ncbi:hypothetical protein CALCODRAFT_35442 [Calocera cornea HHB12733]|uniref:Uncharacterized protein n=1 Tax=Calocera cornea HHB12733 TaxID=1353952 RepID=A0A165E0M2_9BASI|nr:hypothetical protein CALCODRAFT_35442 [Calocera cornea HHB12733]
MPYTTAGKRASERWPLYSRRFWFLTGMRRRMLTVSSVSLRPGRGEEGLTEEILCDEEGAADSVGDGHAAEGVGLCIDDGALLADLARPGDAPRVELGGTRADEGEGCELGALEEPVEPVVRLEVDVVEGLGCPHPPDDDKVGKVDGDALPRADLVRAGEDGEDGDDDEVVEELEPLGRTLVVVQPDSLAATRSMPLQCAAEQWR